MAQQVHYKEEVVLAEELDHARLITLNRPRQLNAISTKMLYLLGEYLEKWEKDDDVKLILIKGAGRVFSAGGDLKRIYDNRNSKDASHEQFYRMYWLFYHVFTYKKPLVVFVHGIAMGMSAILVLPMKFCVVTETTVFSTPEVTLGFHVGGLSYSLSRLPGHLGEYLALTGARLNGKEMIVVGLATHFVPLKNLPELEKRLVRLNNSEERAIKSAIQEFSTNVKIDEDSVLNKKAIIDECFSKDSVEDIIKSFEVEASKEGSSWTRHVLKILKKSSPSSLKLTLKSIRDGRKQTLVECLKNEFRISIILLERTIFGDFYEGIRAFVIDKDNSPKWNPSSLDDVEMEKINMIFQEFKRTRELNIPGTNYTRWGGKYEIPTYAVSKY